MLDMTRKEDRRRLYEAKDWSDKKMQQPRKLRRQGLAELVGKHAFENGARNDVPVNYIEMATTIYLQNIAGGTPRAMVRTHNPQLKPQAADLKFALNKISNELRMRFIFQDLAMDALYGLAVAKIGMVENPYQRKSWYHDLHEPYVSRIDYDDLIVDMGAEEWDRMDFIGHYFWCPLDGAKSNPEYDKPARNRLSSMERRGRREGGDPGVESMASGEGPGINSARPYVRLFEMWLPKENRIVVFPVEEATNDRDRRPLVDKEFVGPESGSYERLFFQSVPKTPLPLPPVATWLDLHQAANDIENKLIGQAVRQKTILPRMGEADDDIDRIARTPDGHSYRHDSSQMPREINLGGPDQRNLAFRVYLQNSINRHFGNLETLGGLSPQAETLGQEEIMAAQSGQRITFMRERMADFGTRVFGQLAWYAHNDEFVDIRGTRPAPGGIEVPFEYNPDVREGDFLEYSFEIDPYSLIHKTPESQLRRMFEIFERMAPFMPIMSEQGVVPNFEAMLRKIAELADLTELNDMFEFRGGPPAPQGQPGGGGESNGKPAHTTRTYERRNRGGSSPGGGSEMELAQQMLDRSA